MIYEGLADAGAARTRTGGVPLAPPGFEWPQCAECDGPMQFQAQIRLDDIDPAEHGLFSIFMCENEPGLCLEWEPDSGGNRAFVFRSDLVPAAVPSDGVVLLPEVSAIAYAATPEVHYERARQRWHSETGGPLRHVLGQVGGAPQWLQDDEALACGCGVAIHTPGHTPGSMSFWFPQAQLLIAGDTLFKRGIGRTDLWGGDFAQIERSIRQRLYTLDEEAVVVTGHGPDTRLGDEMRENPFVRARG